MANIDTSLDTGLAHWQMPGGVIDVRPRAIARIAAAAAMQVPGVVGLVSRLASEASLPPLTDEHLYNGVDVQLHNNNVALEVYVVLAYGQPLAVIAQHAEAAVRAAVEHALGQSIGQVAVRLQGVR